MLDAGPLEFASHRQRIEATGARFAAESLELPARQLPGGRMPVGAEGRGPRRTRDNGTMRRFALTNHIARKQLRLVKRDVELAMKMMLNPGFDTT